jgi:hypothetical protein
MFSTRRIACAFSKRTVICGIHIQQPTPPEIWARQSEPKSLRPLPFSRLVARSGPHPGPASRRRCEHKR